MTTATPKKNKATRRPRCQHCHKQFYTQSTKAIFCTRICKDRATAAKKRTVYITKAADSAFMQTLAFEASRAGTYEIFTGHTAESLAGLYALYVLKQRANRFSDAKDYELSHIAPSQGQDIVGLYHPQNLVVAPKAMNRAHGNQYWGHGLSIDRNKLKSRYMIEKGTPQAEIIKGIIQFIGPDVIAQATKLAGIQPRRRIATLSWLREHLNPHNPQHRDWLDNLDTMHTTALTALKATVQGKEGSDFKIVTRAYTQFEMLLLGIAQQARYRSELTEVHEAVYAAVEAYITANFSSDWLWGRSIAEVVRFMPDTIMTKPELQALFDVLHGKEIREVEPMLEAFAKRCKVRQGLSSAVTPITYKAQQPVLLGTLSFLANAREFADELDAVEGAYVQDVIPVLPRAIAMQPGHTLAYEHDPLPWD